MPIFVVQVILFELHVFCVLLVVAFFFYQKYTHMYCVVFAL